MNGPVAKLNNFFFSNNCLGVSFAKCGCLIENRVRYLKNMFFRVYAQHIPLFLSIMLNWSIEGSPTLYINQKEGFLWMQVSAFCVSVASFYELKTGSIKQNLLDYNLNRLKAEFLHTHTHMQFGYQHESDWNRPKNKVWGTSEMYKDPQCTICVWHKRLKYMIRIRAIMQRNERLGYM